MGFRAPRRRSSRPDTRGARILLSTARRRRRDHLRRLRLAYLPRRAARLARLLRRTRRALRRARHRAGGHPQDLSAADGGIKEGGYGGKPWVSLRSFTGALAPRTYARLIARQWLVTISLRPEHW